MDINQATTRVVVILFWATVAVSVFLILVGRCQDVEHNTQPRPSAQEWYQDERLETSPDAVLRPRGESKVVTPVQEDHSLVLGPLCRHSRYSETGDGLAVQWYSSGLSDHWVQGDSYWRCEQ